MKKILGSVMALGLVLGVSSISYAQTPQGQAPAPAPRERMGGGMEKGRGEMGGDRGPGKMGGGMMRSGMGRGGMNFDRLNLTDAQKQRIQAIQNSFKTSREANKAQMEELGNLMRLKREGLLTSEQGTRLTSLQAQTQTQMKAGMDKMQSDIIAVLTADQKTLLEQQKGDRPGGGIRREGMPGGQRPGGQMRPMGAGAPPAPPQSGDNN